ncbi:SAICAR synthetase [Dipodascopsis tothii]|uniref:SAICAR synthetase n=1 Tax=Dipodascopsis tothii TaxID=44089 RepID=UPI0034CEB3B3
MALVSTDIDSTLPFVARGKVRDIYEVDDQTLLFVATDRISAYDVVMENGIPDKGKLLTQISKFWFGLLKDVCPNHLKSTSIDSLPASVLAHRSQLDDRSMLVQKYKILPIEAIVRGYITGSAWKEYQKEGTVHGIKVREGLREAEKLDTPLFTPSTKADQGEHDINIHPSEVPKIIGEKYAKRVEELALTLYSKAADFAAERGIIIADTKFEFGVDEAGEVVLVDEVLTPDSSRFWPAAEYEIGRDQTSYDKQFLRNWLSANGLKAKEGVSMPVEVVEQTAAKYKEAYEILTGEKWTL